MALWNVFDPKLTELGLISNPDVAKAMYDSAARVGADAAAPHSATATRSKRIISATGS